LEFQGRGVNINITNSEKAGMCSRRTQFNFEICHYTSFYNNSLHSYAERYVHTVCIYSAKNKGALVTLHFCRTKPYWVADEMLEMRASAAVVCVEGHHSLAQAAENFCHSGRMAGHRL